MRQRGVRAVEEAEEVDVHHALPLLDGRVDGRAEQHDPALLISVSRRPSSLTVRSTAAMA
jgi:hypothetical protein